MDRVAVFVDAGYLFAQGSKLLTGSKLTRGQLQLNEVAVTEALDSFARRVADQPLLRIYWYDGTSAGPSAQHLALAYLDRVKLRLGMVNRSGQQKGVDSLIVTDMISLARNRAISDAVLLSGDEDMRVGVQQAQEFGVRVHLLGIAPARSNQSGFLVQEADSTHEWDNTQVAAFLTTSSTAPTAGAVAAQVVSAVAASSSHRMPSGAAPLSGAASFVARATLVADGLSIPEVRGIVAAGRHQIPREVDSQLLGIGKSLLGRPLDEDEKRAIRTDFYAACVARAQGGAASS
ncbi:MAG TPA: NYN domain-containing protein [Longimicrobium sp.]|nr:NYN domain-containing protein [Longimicrobium sp.]